MDYHRYVLMAYKGGGGLLGKFILECRIYITLIRFLFEWLLNQSLNCVCINSHFAYKLITIYHFLINEMSNSRTGSDYS